MDIIKKIIDCNNNNNNRKKEGHKCLLVDEEDCSQVLLECDKGRPELVLEESLGLANALVTPPANLKVHTYTYVKGICFEVKLCNNNHQKVSKNERHQRR